MDHREPSSSLSGSSQPALQRLDGKVAIITGAAGCLGAATARLFAAHGAHVILTDIDNERGQRVAQKISTVNSNKPNVVLYRHCDVSKEADVASVVDFAVEKFGKLDIMHNNAGTMPASTSEFHNLDMDEYDKNTAVLMRGVVLGMKHAGRVMVPRKQGVILTTASVLSVSVDTSVSLIYNLNKQNLPGLTKVAAAHYGRHGIRVNCISPSAVPTEMSLKWARNLGFDIDMDGIRAGFASNSPLIGKHCTEKDVAHAALYLCCDESGFLSGQNLIIDAGFSDIVNFKVNFEVDKAD